VVVGDRRQYAGGRIVAVASTSRAAAGQDGRICGVLPDQFGQLGMRYLSLLILAASALAWALMILNPEQAALIGGSWGATCTLLAVRRN
jgi:hypothetical protein